MKTIWYVPLEHLDKRYTNLMDKQIIKEFETNNINYKCIDGEYLTDKIETGFFLDAIGTNYFKASQIMEIMKLFKSNSIKDDDIFFFSDLWFPGIESIPYTASFMKKNVKITGMLHAGSWTETDDVRTFMRPWAKHIEKGWLKFIDTVYLGSEHHKQEILYRKRTKDEDKLKVTGLAFSSNDILNIAKPLPWEERDDVIVFPHRIHWEKQPKVFDEFMKKIPNYKAIKTMEHDFSKTEYLNLLGRSKFSFSSALQENFGYSMIESYIMGCVPILPNSLSYKEFFDSDLRYNNLDEAVNIFNKYKHKGLKERKITKWDDGMKNIVNDLKSML